MKQTKQITMSEELFNQIVDDLHYASGARMNDDTVHMSDVYTTTIGELEQAYEDGHYTDVVEAYKRLSEGETPNWSIGLCGTLTAGYEECDSTGYFKFPLILDEDTNGIMSWEDYIK